MKLKQFITASIMFENLHTKKLGAVLVHTVWISQPGKKIISTREKDNLTIFWFRINSWIHNLRMSCFSWNLWLENKKHKGIQHSRHSSLIVESAPTFILFGLIIEKIFFIGNAKHVNYANIQNQLKLCTFRSDSPDNFIAIKIH